MLPRTWACLVLSMLVGACGTVIYQPSRQRSVQAARIATQLRPGFTRLVVSNRNAEDVRIYLIRSGTRIFVGTVGSMTTRRFTLSPAETSASGTLTLAAETLVSGQRHDGELLDFEAGQAIEWRIESRPGLSTLQPLVLRLPR